jgi:salicylate 5-hydroxylase small subunit
MNFERGLPLATWLSESRGMLEDRVMAIRQLSTYSPRYLRHIVSGIRILGWNGDAVRCEASYAVFETLPDELTRVFQVGRYLDRIVIDEGRLRFAEKLCVFDSELIPNTLVYPI